MCSVGVVVKICGVVVEKREIFVSQTEFQFQFKIQIENTFNILISSYKNEFKFFHSLGFSSFE